ncbi:hypothetical protein A1O1_02966 [Capronia coronata CBS 617.96]|uniref:General transcription and DNA repair factor IIH subunit TFB4 n=1 Tax=Capronia coronata CBS 617.96 TaxID=1182541 RepID=W9YY07_9EURO|nr:uncharacterized protein A1O1_02966 [Capronia coronata CBS 617.96]EXJ94570.1 hypothetical protein A1O1_02966 [Capronia coronata CBS 617.96]
MNAVDGSDHFGRASHDQAPSLLTIILDTNPAAWSLLSSTLPFSSAIANILVFINAHLAGNYTNKVAVIASHCDRATWLYPTPTEQKPPPPRSSSSSADPNNRTADGASGVRHDLSESTKRLKLNPHDANNDHDSSKTPLNLDSSSPSSLETGNKYRPFRLVEEEVLQNLTALLSSTTPDAVSRSPTTMIAGALTLALSYINRESIAYAESLIGMTAAVAETSTTGATGGGGGGVSSSTTTTGDASTNSSLQSRILLVSVSPSTDLAHQYIPIMNAIFACQRLAIPIDIMQLPLPTQQGQQPQPPKQPTNNNTSTTNTTTSNSQSTSSSSSSNSTVFLQQAADATHGIFIAVQLPSPSPSLSGSTSTSDTPSTSPSSTTTTKASQAFLSYLLASLLPSPSTRAAHLILPTRIDVDFRAACFCHRNVVSIGFVCSICLSIFCSVPDNGDCLTCGTHLSLGRYGARPVVVAKKSKKKQHSAAAK